MKNNSMSKVEMLWIRACKSGRPERLASVYRRFYYGWDSKQKNMREISYILAHILDKYKLCDAFTLTEYLHHDNLWKIGADSTMSCDEIFVKAMSSIIGSTPKDDLVCHGFIAPSRFSK